MIEMNVNSDLLSIPEGYANGAMNLEENSKIIYFSSSDLEDSLNDDYRFDSKYWDPWTSNGGEFRFIINSGGICKWSYEP
jgi:hypothetical protein